ncbi:MAG: SPFH domain-containing protein, partial [Candidimonas sp.]
MSWIIAGIVAVVAIIMMVVIGLILSKLYVRAHKDTAYVRTGLGGQKVVKDGGSLVIGIFQNITHVNMRTLKLTISRREKESLITKDRLRIDIAVDFFVRVKPDSDSIAVAAQTLGDLTMQPDQLRNLIEPKLVDVLRSVAATMEMEQIHEQRQEFVQSVQTVLASDIAKNGLELETVSLTSLDQTDHRHFNPDNAFDAEGMRKLVEITQGNMKRRNDIQRDTEVAIAMRDRDAEMEQLNIKQATEEARLNQERDIALKTADQQTLIAQSEASAKQRSELARIEADKQIRDAEIAS